MIRFIRAIFVGLLVASLAASGATSAHAKIAGEAKAPEHAAQGAMHQHHQQVIAADDEHCPHAAVSRDTSQRHSHDSNECKTCCIACIIHGVMPEALVAIPASAPGDTIYQSCKVLSGLIASADPGIPKL